MNIMFEHYSHQLNLQVEKFEKACGCDIQTAVVNEYAPTLHTMQVEGEIYQQIAQECSTFDDADLKDLQSYERNLKQTNGAMH